MAEQREEIILAAIPDEAIAGTNKANAAVDGYEKKSIASADAVTKNFADNAAARVSIIGRSQSTIDRLTAAYEKKAAFSGASKAEQLAAERDFTLGKVSGDPKAVEKVNIAYEKQLTVLKQIEQADAGAKRAKEVQSLLDKAVSSSKQAESATRQFNAALSSVNSTAAAGVASLEKRANLTGASGSKRLALQEADDLQKFGNSAANVDKITAAYGKLRAEQEAADAKPGFLQSIIQAGIFLEIAQKVISVLKDITVGSALYSARTDQLGVALNVVAKANGISATSTGTLEKQIEGLGVTTQATRENLTKLIVAQVDYTKSVKLASLAQNIGRISGEGTVEAFDRIRLAIVSGNERVVRSIGLNVSFQASYEKVAAAQNRAAADLTEYEKIQIRTNALLDAGVAVNGVYAASLDTVAGRLMSLERQALDAKDALGSKFQGEALLTLIGLEKLAKTITKYPNLFADLTRGALVAGGSVAAIVGGPVIAAFGLSAVAVGFLSVAVSKLKDVYDDARTAKLLFLGKDEQLAKEAGLFDVAAAKFAEANKVPRELEQGAIDAKAIQTGKILQEARKKSVVVEREAAQERIEALGAEAGGIRKIELEREKSLKSKSTFLDSSGIERSLTLTSQTMVDVNRTAQAKIAIEVRKTEEQIRQDRNKTADLLQENEKINVKSRSDLELVHLDNVLAREVLDRRTIENERLSLHSETIDRVAAMDRKLIDDQSSREITKLQSDEKRKGTSAGRIFQLTSELQKQATEKDAQVDRAASDAKRKSSEELNNVRIQRDRDFSDKRKDFEFATSQQVLENQRTGLSQSKDLQLEQLGLVQDQSIKSKLITEQARLNIEVDFLRQSKVIQLKELDARHGEELDKIREEESRAGISHDEALKTITASEERYQIARRQLAADTDAAINLSATRTAVQQTETLNNHYKSVYDSIKQSAGGVFDQLFTKSQNIFQAIGNVFKTAMLTALKEVVTSKIAATFTELLTGAKVSLTPAGLPGQGGTLAKLGQILGIGATPSFRTPGLSKLEQVNHLGDAQLVNGALPVYLSGSTVQGAGTPGVSALASSIPGLGGALGLGLAGLAGASTLGRGATSVASTIYTSSGAIIAQPTFAGGTAGTVGAAGGSSSIAGAGGIAGIFGSLKSGVGGFLTQLGGIGATSKLFSKGIYGSTGGALLAGGGILAADGLRRGGLTGLGETTAGGALIGAKFGGPIGALIGAGIGALAGTIRLFIKGAETKLIEKVQTLYGIKISKQLAQQILAEAKSSYGGNTDVAIRSPQIRDLLQLYAESTGQQFGGAAAKVQSLALSQSGGQLYQAPTFQNGSALPSLGGSIPSLGISGAGQQSAGAQPYAIQITATDQQVSDFMTTKTLNIMASNPRAISSANLQGAKANSARRETLAAMTEPGLQVS